MGKLLSDPAGGQPSGTTQLLSHSIRSPNGAARGAAFATPFHPARPPASRWPDDIAFLAKAGLAPILLSRADGIAARKNMAASEVLIHRGVIAREDYERLLAAEVGAIWRPDGPDPALIEFRPPASTDALRAVGAMERRPGGTRLFVSPQASDYRRVAAMARHAPETFEGVCFTGQAVLKRALFEANRQGFARRAVNDLARRLPHYSASRRLSVGQVVAACAIVTALCGGLLADARAAFLSVAVFLSGFYFAIVVLRAILIVFLDLTGLGNRRPRPTRPCAPENHPVYSVLVALKGEAGQVGTLVEALDRLDWPVTKREIFLICEEDDPDTIAAIRRLDLPEGFELVICPPCAPRTKPKALDFALPLCSGRYVVIYDAEDRPHPLQLREAWQKLENGGDRLACVQAPLLIHNQRQSWLTRLFAVEYRTQFLGTLPILEMLGAPLSLGGTSNHFNGLMYQAHQAFRGSIR